MKLVVSVNLQREMVPGSSGTVIPEDMGKQEENASFTISGYNYPGKMTAFVKAMTNWIEEHQNLTEVPENEVEASNLMKTFLNNQKSIKKE